MHLPSEHSIPVGLWALVRGPIKEFPRLMSSFLKHSGYPLPGDEAREGNTTQSGSTWVQSHIPHNEDKMTILKLQLSNCAEKAHWGSWEEINSLYSSYRCDKPAIYICCDITKGCLLLVKMWRQLEKLRISEGFRGERHISVAIFLL